MFKESIVLLITVLAISDGQYVNRIQHGTSGSWGRPAAYQSGWNGGQSGWNGGQSGWNGGWGGSWNGALGGGALRGGYVAGRSFARPSYATHGAGYRGPINQPVGAYVGGALPTRVFQPVGAYVGGALPTRVSQPVGAYVGGALPARVSQPQPYYGGRYEDESPKPYSFGYDTVDEYGTQLGRQEVADGSGTVRGSYSYRDPNGQFRQVQYVADEAGFRAEVDTNEHGVVSHRPADAVYNVHQ